MKAQEPSEKSIFLEAIEIESATERAEFLDKACAGNPLLRDKAEALLQAHENPQRLMDNLGAAAPTIDAPSSERPGTVIGPYKLLQQIGEGGMGTVYMAEQTQPIQRKVALKIIKAGMDSRQVIARFEAERQALAMMDHVNIARVFDGGATEAGLPYFVMELVHGVPITKYCDEHYLTPRQRLELFIPVCQAIQHAHQKGIIHRDIKPSNVLVAPYDGKPVIKIIDFGVAKATGQQLTDKTLFTDFGSVVGTIEYMSPEQAELNNQDIDTRSDIYSLGVVLYELLTGTTPLSRARLKEAAFAEMLRMIREEEPPKPSTRLSESKDSLPTISAQRQTEPAKLTKLVRAELDWIVMKALDKNRSRRYESANGLAMDLQCYLADEPVQACPPSAGYRLRKFVRRNRGAVTAALIVTAALLVGIMGTTWGMVKAGQRRSEADKARTDAERARSAEAEQREQAVANLYDSLVREARALRLARGTGYRGQAWQRLREAARLDTPKRNLDELRREAAASLGDFVGLEPKVLRGRWKSHILSLALHPQAPLLAVGSADGTITLHRLPDWAETAHWQAHPKASIVSVAYHPDGSGLASAAADGTVTIWQTGPDGGWVPQRTLKGDPLKDPGRSNSNSITVAFTSDGKQLVASCLGSSIIRFWRTGDGQLLEGLKVQGQLAGPMALSPDGKLLAAGCYVDGKHTVLVWDIATREVAQDVEPNLGLVRAVSFSHDSKLFACGCGAGMAVFDASTAQRQLYSLGGDTPALAFTGDGQRLACGGQIGGTELWDLVTNREVAKLVQPATPGEIESGWVNSIALSSNGKTMVSASGKALALWNLEGADERQLLKQFAGGVPGVAFSPRGNLLASISKDRSITLWDTATGQLVRRLPDCLGAGQAVAFSPDGRLLATGDWSGEESIRIYDVESGLNLASLDPKLGGVWSVNFTRDGHYFAASGEYGWVIWKVNRVKAQRSTKKAPLLEELTRQQIRKGVGCVCFTPDGSVLAWVERDNTFHLWDLAGARERPAPASKLAGFVRTIWLDDHGLGLDEQGKWLCYAAPDGVEVWDLATERRIGPIVPLRELKVLPDEKMFWCADLSADRTRFAVGGGDGSLVLWDLAKVRARLEEAGLGWDTGK
jgi:eukaryotic-like serine/threonine-protein kinase